MFHRQIFRRAFLNELRALHRVLQGVDNAQTVQRCAFGKAQIAEFDSLRGNPHDVVRLDIPVEDPFPLEVFQSLGHFQADKKDPVF